MNYTNEGRADIQIPGLDLDPGRSIEKHVKAGWGLVGIAFSGGLLTFLLRRLGISIWPEHPVLMDYGRFAAFAVSVLNILGWMWFPLDDLAVARFWVRTKKQLFPCHTSEFFVIILGTLLLIALAISALASPIWFGLVGTAIYLWNFVGFEHIKKKVRLAVTEARGLYRQASMPRAEILGRALDVIDRHWCSAPTRHWLVNKQQIRHGSLFLAFLLDTVLASIGTIAHMDSLKLFAYFLGVAIIIAAETSIAIWRNARDFSLTELEGELRSLEA